MLISVKEAEKEQPTHSLWEPRKSDKASQKRKWKLLSSLEILKHNVQGYTGQKGTEDGQKLWKGSWTLFFAIIRTVPSGPLYPAGLPERALPLLRGFNSGWDGRRGGHSATPGTAQRRSLPRPASPHIPRAARPPGHGRSAPPGAAPPGPGRARWGGAAAASALTHSSRRPRVRACPAPARSADGAGCSWAAAAAGAAPGPPWRGRRRAALAPGAGARRFRFRLARRGRGAESAPCWPGGAGRGCPSVPPSVPPSVRLSVGNCSPKRRLRGRFVLETRPTAAVRKGWRPRGRPAVEPPPHPVCRPSLGRRARGAARTWALELHLQGKPLLRPKHLLPGLHQSQALGGWSAPLLLGLCPSSPKSVVCKNRISYLVCNKPINTRTRETLIIHFRVVRTWMFGGIS